jgi:hypothetical protein
MSIVIHLDDDLARRLESEARQRKLPVEQLAITILNDAVSPSRAGHEWGERNRRRLELIRKSSRCELTEQEQTELDGLQSWLDAQFEAFDAGLATQLDAMKQTVGRTSAEQRNE